MPLYYKAIQSNVESEDGKKKWFPCLVKSKKIVETDTLADQISYSSTLTRGDVKNVLDNLMVVMRQHLMNSSSVRLEGLGTFTAFVQSKGNGVDTPEEVNPSQINRLRIRFSPTYTRNTFNGTTRAMYEGVSFERWPDGATGSPGDDGDDTDPLG
ncbi:MAG: HU family DNA-binding protein [Bacteroides sp.]|nr:HU family DNA-binding protein [Bacteroides sp.]